MFDQPGAYETVNNQQSHRIPSSERLPDLDDDHEFEDRDNHKKKEE
jgi:hypothetical protein